LAFFDWNTLHLLYIFTTYAGALHIAAISCHATNLTSMEEKGHSPRKHNDGVATQVELRNGSGELAGLEEENYKMTKTTYMAVIAFSWSWACVSCMNTTTTTLSHQVASVGGVGELAWIANASLIVQVATQAIMVNNFFHSEKHTNENSDRVLLEIIMANDGSSSSEV
jgi:hypothetical protein